MALSELDCRELLCPMPIVQLSMAVKKLSSGDLLQVLATDPAFKPDLDAWAELTGHAVIEFQDGPVKKATLRVA